MSSNGDHLINRVAPWAVLAAALLALVTPPTDRPPRAERPQPKPPGPPIVETFQGRPQLALFPRVATFRPEDNDSLLPFWETYREHLLKTSGVVNTNAGGNRAFSFRGIAGLDSVGQFAPLAVAPNSSYRLSLKLHADLPDNARISVGLIEYRRFIWVDTQYPKTLHDALFVANRELLSLSQTNGWRQFELPFSTGADTGMIHLVFVREGEASRVPVLLDDIVLEKIDPQR